jgi:hypothetical protein
MSTVGKILGFTIDWFDPVSSLVQTMFLKFFVDDNTIEILTDKSAFLKRIYYPDVKLSELFLGNTITMYVNIVVLPFVDRLFLFFITNTLLAQSPPFVHFERLRQ